MAVTPRKRFGQNFLVDQGIIHKLVAAIAPRETDHILEIGPGQGALTDSLVQSACNLVLVEIDRDLSAMLQARFPDTRLIQADILKADLEQLLTRPTRVVGNLPYNISTPLLFKLFRHTRLITDMHFMLQLEVVDRMAALPSTKAYGRLSIMTQYYCQVDKLFEVPPESFSPRPKVQSAIVRLIPHHDRLDVDVDRLEHVLVNAFSARRKTLRNALGKLLSADDLVALGLNPGARPETLSIEDFARCARFLGERSA